MNSGGIPAHDDPAHVIGGGLAGGEAAWQLARASSLIREIR
jgi:folate-dependent tRNA-U54 methylase TrmFO/GidA